MEEKTDYEIGAIFVFWISFVGYWIYCISKYGFLVGVGLGWFPSAIAAGITALVWPVLAFVLAIIFMFAVSDMA